MAAHRYWRIAITANNGNASTCLLTVRFFDASIFDEITISGGTASASTTYSGTYSADKAIDGDTHTGWNNAADMPCWWQYDFGSGNEKTIAGVGIQAVYVAGGFISSVAPKDFALQWSDDGTSWTSLISTSNQTVWGDLELKYFWFTHPARILNPIIRRDVIDGGSLSIIEPVTRMNAIPPQPLHVRLYDRKSGRIVRAQWSYTVTGEVNFTNLRVGPWDLLAHDHTYEFESVAISDREATVDGLRP